MSEEQIAIYNEFVDCMKNKLVRDVNVSVDLLGSMIFFIETDNGISNEEAKKMFGDMVRKYPGIGFNYNLPAGKTALEEILLEKCETVISVSSGFYLQKI